MRLEHKGDVKAFWNSTLCSQPCTCFLSWCCWRGLGNWRSLQVLAKVSGGLLQNERLLLSFPHRLWPKRSEDCRALGRQPSTAQEHELNWKFQYSSFLLWLFCNQRLQRATLLFETQFTGAKRRVIKTNPNTRWFGDSRESKDSHLYCEGENHFYYLKNINSSRTWFSGKPWLHWGVSLLALVWCCLSP